MHVTEELPTGTPLPQMSIDLAAHEVLLGEQKVALTPTEFRLLLLLVAHEGRPVGSGTLAAALWGEQVDSRCLVKKNVYRLRRKLGDDPLEPEWLLNVYGFGYAFIGEVSIIPGPDRRTLPRKLPLFYV